MPKLSIRDLDLKNKHVLMRVDFNVPLTEDGSEITDDTRIRETLPTIQYALEQRAKLILASHLGRPKGKPNPKYSLRPVVDRLRTLLDHAIGERINVAFSPDCVGEIAQELSRQLESGQVLLLENLRFHPEEEANDPAFAKKLASLCEIYVNDAFGTAHRAHASTEGITHHVKQAAAGLLMEKEIAYLGQALGLGHEGTAPAKPFVAILGGAKVSDKIGVIDNLLGKVDALLIGGGMAYTFLKARGQGVGKSLVEADKIELAGEMLKQADEQGVRLLLPTDHVLADRFAPDAATQLFSGTGDFPLDWMALDIGPETIEAFSLSLIHISVPDLIRHHDGTGIRARQGAQEPAQRHQLGRARRDGRAAVLGAVVGGDGIEDDEADGVAGERDGELVGEDVGLGFEVWGGEGEDAGEGGGGWGGGG